MVARLDAASRVTQGGEAELWFDTERLQLFDAESGESMMPSRDGNRAATPASTAPPASSSPSAA
jgi:hypothetical protein